MEADPAFTHGRYRLEWVYIGEGMDGEYDCTNPDDKPLLRADLYGDDEMLDSGSYCTGAHLRTPVEDLEVMSKDLFRDLPDNPAHFSKRVMEMWTWRTM